jgi:hypothetical protein
MNFAGNCGPYNTSQFGIWYVAGDNPNLPSRTYTTNFEIASRPTVATDTPYRMRIAANITVAPATATAITTPRVLNVGVDEPAFEVMGVSGGQKPYICEVAEGVLPPGLTLTATETTCRVAGTPTTQQAAADVTFRVKGADGVYAATSSTVRFTVNGAAPVASNVRITGTAMVGEPLVGAFDYSDADGDAAGTHTYAWYRADDAAGTLNRAPIAGATASTYTVTAADFGKYLVFEVVPKSATGTPDTGTAASAVTAASMSAALTATANDTAQVLVAETAMTAFAPLTVIGGRTPYTYEITSGTLPAGLSFDPATGLVSGTPATQQPVVSVSFRVRDADGIVAATTSTVAFTIEGRAPVASNVAIAGTPIVDETLTGSFDYSDADNDAAGTHVYRWYRADNPSGTVNRTPINGATTTTYTVTTADIGKYLVFEVTPKSTTGAPDTGVAVSVVTPTSVQTTLAATADDTAQVLRVGAAMATFTPLTASGGRPPYLYEITSGTLPTGLSFDPATGAVTGTPTLQQAAMMVTFGVRDASGMAAPTTSTVAFSVNGEAPVANNVVLSGTAEVSQVLTGSFDYSDADGDAAGTHVYRWYRADDASGTNRTVIVGAVATTYTVLAADLGKYLIFEVTPKSATGLPDTGQPASATTASAVGWRVPVASNVRIVGDFPDGTTVEVMYDFDDPDGDAEGATVYDGGRGAGRCGLGTP